MPDHVDLPHTYQLKQVHYWASAALPAFNSSVNDNQAAIQHDLLSISAQELELMDSLARESLSSNLPTSLMFRTVQVGTEHSPTAMLLTTPWRTALSDDEHLAHYDGD